VKRKQLIAKAYIYIENDSVDGRLTKCKLLGKNLKNAPASDVQAYLYDEADKNPLKVIDLYTNGDTALKLLIIDAKERNILRKKDGLYVYGESIMGATDEALMMYLKTATNKKILDLIKREVYPEFARQVDMGEPSPSVETASETSEKPKSKK
jgi:hypothetical protein